MTSIGPDEGAEHGSQRRALARFLSALESQSDQGWGLSVSVVCHSDPEMDHMLSTVSRASLHRARPGIPRMEALAEMVSELACAALCLLDTDDELAPDAVAYLRTGLSDADVAYGDEDAVGPDGQYEAPKFKPDWSPNLLLDTPYLGRPTALRREVLEAAGGLREVPGGDWEHDLFLRIAEHAPAVVHVPEVLSHRHRGPREPTRATAGRSKTSQDGLEHVRQALARRSERAEAAPGPLARTYRVVREPERPVTVSIIICSRDAPVLLRRCIDSIDATVGRGPEVQLVLVDNGSSEPEAWSLLEHLGMRADVTVLRDPRPFNWAALNNHAAERADGEVLVFLNDDIEARGDGWLTALAAQALRDEVGAVGARLLYPDGRVQHAGTVIGLGGAAGNLFTGLPADKPGYLGLAVLTRDCSAVMGACLATRRNVFFDLGRFDEELRLDLSETDYCLRGRSSGLAVVYEPQAELVHHEGPSRGTSGSNPDIIMFVERWAAEIDRGDPFLNANLTRADPSCALRDEGEAQRWREWRERLAV